MDLPWSEKKKEKGLVEASENGFTLVGKKKDLPVSLKIQEMQ